MDAYNLPPKRSRKAPEAGAKQKESPEPTMPMIDIIDCVDFVIVQPKTTWNHNPQKIQYTEKARDIVCKALT